jgi:hypothetical protein
MAVAAEVGKLEGAVGAIRERDGGEVELEK